MLERFVVGLVGSLWMMSDIWVMAFRSIPEPFLGPRSTRASVMNGMMMMMIFTMK